MCVPGLWLGWGTPYLFSFGATIPEGFTPVGTDYSSVDTNMPLQTGNTASFCISLENSRAEGAFGHINVPVLMSIVEINTKVKCTSKTYKEWLSKETPRKGIIPIFKLYRNFYS